MALKEEGQDVKNRAHRTFGPVRMIWNDQATCYLVYNQFRSTLAKSKKSLEIELQTIVCP